MFPRSLVLVKTEQTLIATHWTYNFENVMKHARSNVIFCSNFPTFMFFQWSWVEIRYYCPFSCNNTSKVGSDPNLGHYKVGYRENLPFHCSSPILPILHIWTNVACSHMTQTRTSGVLASVMWNLLKHVEMQTLGSFFFFFYRNGWLVKHIFCSYLVWFHINLMHGRLLLGF